MRSHTDTQEKLLHEISNSKAAGNNKSKVLIVCFYCGHQFSYQTGALWHCRTFSKNATL